jgi:hypothetical protein
MGPLIDWAVRFILSSNQITDFLPPRLQVTTLLKMPGCKRVPLLVESDDDVITASASFVSEKYATLCAF